MSLVGELRVTKWKITQWCESTLDHELIGAGDRLLCFDNPGYVRAYCLDDQRVYHLSNNSFLGFTTPYGEP